jgi:hypothetical protein
MSITLADVSSGTRSILEASTTKAANSNRKSGSYLFLALVELQSSFMEGGRLFAGLRMEIFEDLTWGRRVGADGLVGDERGSWEDLALGTADL